LNTINSKVEDNFSDWTQGRELIDPIGDEPQIFMAIQTLNRIESWVKHSKLLELIKVTKKELFNYFENPYAILRAYDALQDMKQGNLDIKPKDFHWFNDFNTALDPVMDYINIPLKIMLLKKNDEELYAIDCAQKLSVDPNLQPIRERKLTDIARIVEYLYRYGHGDKIEKLAFQAELLYPLYLEEVRVK